MNHVLLAMHTLLQRQTVQIDLDTLREQQSNFQCLLLHQRLAGDARLQRSGAVIVIPAHDHRGAFVLAQLHPHGTSCPINVLQHC